MSNLPLIDENNFDNETAHGVVLVDFYADWCGPCKTLGPILDQLSQEVSNVKFIKVDVDASQTLAAKFSVTSIPTVVILKEGKEVNRFVGVQDEQSIKAMLHAH